MRNIVNPKTLKGQDKVNRMLDLMGKMSTLNESKSFSELELIKRGPNGIVYGIVRENHDYFIKTSNKPYGQFLSEDFQYIGGLQNKGTEKYHSYAEALKHLNIKFDMLNESYGVEYNNNIFESDGNAISGGAGFGFVLEKEEEIILDDDIKEQKKVLKVDTPKSETPAAPVEDEVADDEFGFSDDTSGESDTEEDSFGDDTETDVEDTEATDEEGTEDLGDDEITKKIQKMTGKIGQMLRDSEEVDPKLEKYVINSIISALHLDEMDESDKEDIISKFEGEDEEDSFGSDSDLDTLDSEEDTEETETPEESPEAPEEGTEELSESRGRIFSKKQLLESFLNRSTKNSIKKVLKERKEICNECGGYKGGNLVEGMMCECSPMNEEEYDGFKDGRKKIDLAKPYGTINADDLRKVRSMKRKRHIDEDEMDVMDALQTGQGYLSATGDLDRDYDGIPNRLDLDNNSDGDLDFSMNSRNSFEDDFIELDIDFLRSNAPVKEPGIKTPTTKPGTGTDWDKIKRPKADPKPKATDNGERMRPSYRRRGMFR